MKIIIKQAGIQDVETLLSFNLNMALETENLVLPSEKLRPGIESALNDENKGIYYVALIDNQIAGSLMITREWSDWRNSWVAWIQSVYVKKEYRRQGVYSALYQHIKNKVILGEFAGIRLYVDKTNHNALKTYSSLGMNGEHYSMFEWMKDY